MRRFLQEFIFIITLVSLMHEKRGGEKMIDWVPVDTLSQDQETPTLVCVSAGSEDVAAIFVCDEECERLKPSLDGDGLWAWVLHHFLLPLRRCTAACDQVAVMSLTDADTTTSLQNIWRHEVTAVIDRTLAVVLWRWSHPPCGEQSRWLMDSDLDVNTTKTCNQLLQLRPSHTHAHTQTQTNYCKRKEKNDVREAAATASCSAISHAIVGADAGHAGSWLSGGPD